MRITRLLPAALAGCLLLVVLVLGMALPAGRGVSGAVNDEAGLWLAPQGVAEASDARLPDGAITSADEPVLYEIDNPAGSPDYWVHWSAYTDTITYTLQEGDSPEFVDPMVRYSGEMTGTMVTEQVGGIWYYRVKATTSGGDTPWSNVVSTTVVVTEPVLWGYLPLVMNRWPPLPYAPELNPITDPEGDGAYQVSWVELPERLADTYTLQEATNPAFSANLRTVCTTAQQSCGVSGRQPGTYYYRVRGENTWGTGDWSPTGSIVVIKLLLNGDFEDGSGVGWAEYSDHGWQIILHRDDLPEGLDPHSGDWAAWLGGDFEDLSWVAQEVTVQSGSAYLVFWTWIASLDDCGYDHGGVVVNSHTVVDVFDLCYDENTWGWVRRSVDLTDYAGQTITFDIRAETDEAYNSNLFVDDVSFAAGRLGAAFRPGEAGPDVVSARGEWPERPLRMVPGEMTRPRLAGVRPE
jgi:hypothetical protein